MLICAHWCAANICHISLFYQPLLCECLCFQLVLFHPTLRAKLNTVKCTCNRPNCCLFACISVVKFVYRIFSFIICSRYLNSNQSTCVWVVLDNEQESWLRRTDWTIHPFSKRKREDEHKVKWRWFKRRRMIRRNHHDGWRRFALVGLVCPFTSRSM